MNENLRDFIQYGDSNRLPALLIDFVGSIFTAWVMSIALFAIKDWVQEKLRKKSESKPTSDYHLTKLSKPLSDMNESERRQAAEDISETIQKQIDDYKGKKSDD
jgi:hypothetical protein